MKDAEFTEPAGWLVEAAQRAGFEDFSASRLKRLRLDGLLPENRRIGGGWCYPTRTSRHLLGLLTIERWEDLNTHKQLGWRAWWFGWPVAQKYWQPQLKNAAATWDRTLRRLNRFIFDDDNDIGDQGFRLIDTLKVKRSPFKPFRQLRKRLGWYFDGFTVMMLRLALGQFQALGQIRTDNGGVAYATEDDTKDAKILDRGLGLDAARKNHLKGIQPWLSGDITEELHRLSKTLRSLSLQAVLISSTAEDLNKSRFELVTILRYIYSAHENLKKKRGLHAFGFGVISKFLNLEWPMAEALFLLLFHAAKQDERFAANVSAYVNMLLALKMKQGETA